MQVATQPRLTQTTPGRALSIEELAKDHYAAVYRFCARCVGEDLASDLAQETFVTAQKSLHRFSGRSRASTWLIGIAHNECRNAVRKRKLDPPPLRLDPAHPGNLERAIVDRDALTIALNRLSPAHREVVVLHELEELTYEETAKVLGVPIGTVKSRLHHAFAQLRQTLAATNPNSDYGPTLGGQSL